MPDEITTLCHYHSDAQPWVLTHGDLLQAVDYVRAQINYPVVRMIEIVWNGHIIHTQRG